MMLAWLSSSESTRTPRPPSAHRVPRLAAKPVGKQMAASVPFHSASSRSSSLWTGREPVTRREAPAPAPHRSSASWAARTTSGCALRPEVIVGGKRHDGVPLEGAGRAAGVELPGSSPPILGDHLGQLPSDAVGPGHRGLGWAGGGGAGGGRAGEVVEAAAQRVDDADDLVLGRGEWGHQHDDIAERTQQDAPLDRAGTDPSAPAQTGGGRRQLDADHEATLTDFEYLGALCDALGQQGMELVGPRPHVGEHVPVVHQAQMLERDGGRQSIPAVGVPVVEGLRTEVAPEEGVEHPARSDRGRHGQVAAGDPLAQTQQVGSHPALLGGEERAGAAEAGRHLVADEQRAGPAAGLAHLAHVGRRGAQHPCRALHQRLDARPRPARRHGHRWPRTLWRPIRDPCSPECARLGSRAARTPR